MKDCGFKYIKTEGFMCKRTTVDRFLTRLTEIRSNLGRGFQIGRLWRVGEGSGGAGQPAAWRAAACGGGMAGLGRKRPSGARLARVWDWTHAREHANSMAGLVRNISERSDRAAAHGGAAVPAS